MDFVEGGKLFEVGVRNSKFRYSRVSSRVLGARSYTAVLPLSWALISKPLSMILF